MINLKEKNEVKKKITKEDRDEWPTDDPQIHTFSMGVLNYQTPFRENT